MIPTPPLFFTNVYVNRLQKHTRQLFESQLWWQCAEIQTIWSGLPKRASSTALFLRTTLFFSQTASTRSPPPQSLSAFPSANFQAADTLICWPVDSRATGRDSSEAVGSASYSFLRFIITLFFDFPVPFLDGVLFNWADLMQFWRVDHFNYPVRFRSGFAFAHSHVNSCLI